ncbi:phage tail tape measure protein [Salmonella enterica subsp. enterica serovar Rubislaw]|nr:phage tail tape measure protein [Salmonella enterica subsp. enterica serovar Rubislaw]ECX3423103.1 phage tail tape measure protein [Salmonella enterica subsp. enterica serovar Rubislaw]ECX6384221.1 phage tail tape measure protein [Salmonella enterica subsp. enterica serovar Rubislaw]EEC2013948.1 phage tail tape measure protein [Salmonella enterica subsp. enterica serovar Rubislaw]
MADSFQLKAIITAVDQLSGPLKDMQKQLKGFHKEVSGLGVGAGVAGASILGVFAGATQSAMGLENHMADARKAIEELHDPKAFRQMTEQLIDMSTRLPMSAEGLAEITAEAGQAGIPFKELAQFTEDATKAAVGFGMTANEAGHQLAVWRTAFKLTQKEVMNLSDQMNYLAMTGPTTEKQIGDVVTSVGNLATTAGVSTSDLAAIAATITGVGVSSDVAGTGVQNFMLALTNANTNKAKAVLKSIGLTSKEVATGMQKDSRGMMLRVLEGLGKISKDKQAKGLEWLFGRESIKAIAPLLTNLDLLKKNFNSVSDASKYAGATQREYDSRVNTTEKQLQILKNQFTALAVTVGSEFLPIVVDATKAMAPYMKEALQWVRNNPDVIKSIAKFGLALSAVSMAMGGVSRAVKIMNMAFNLSPAKLAVGALVIGAYEIIEHWDEVGPVIKDVWQEVDKVAQAMGGWETVIEGIGLVMAGSFTVRTIGTLQLSVLLAGQLSGLLGKIGRMGAMTLTIGVAVSLFKELKDLEQGAKDAGMDTGAFAVQKLQTKERERGYNGFIPRLKELLGMDTPIPQGRYQPYVPLTRRSGVLERAVPPSTQRSELKVTFENAPQGMRVTDIPKSGNPLMNISHDVGYSPFRTSR